MSWFTRNKRLEDINRKWLVDIREAKATESGAAAANRYMALGRAILNCAVEEWEWLDKVPKVPMRKLRKKRIRTLRRDEAEKLLSLLPEHQAVMARFGLATGLRQRNVCQLEWSQVDLEGRIAWIHPDQAKAGEAIGVPLNAEALMVLRQRSGKHAQFVFVYEGKPVWQVNTKAWRNAVAKAGLKNFRRHDLRHTWASWHARAGTPLNALQEMGGWRTPAMVQRYAHLNTEHLLPYAERIVPESVTKLVSQSRDGVEITS